MFYMKKPVGYFISANRHDIKAVQHTGTWDVYQAPKAEKCTGLWGIIGNKPIRTSLDSGGVMYVDLVGVENGGGYSHYEW